MLRASGRRCALLSQLLTLTTPTQLRCAGIARCILRDCISVAYLWWLLRRRCNGGRRATGLAVLLCCVISDDRTPGIERQTHGRSVLCTGRLPGVIDAAQRLRGCSLQLASSRRQCVQPLWVRSSPSPSGQWHRLPLTSGLRSWSSTLRRRAALAGPQASGGATTPRAVTRVTTAGSGCCVTEASDRATATCMCRCRCPFMHIIRACIARVWCWRSVRLQLDTNWLNGTIPASIGTLTALTYVLHF